MRQGTAYGGFLAVLEGGDGTGKSTQARLLEERLSAAGRKCMRMDFPDKAGNPAGRLVAEYLGGDHGSVPPEFVALAFAADRLAAKGRMLEALRGGHVVLCDRYVTSNVALQCGKLADPARRSRLATLIEWLEYDVHGLPAPDLEIVLTARDGHYESGSHLERKADAGRDYAAGRADVHEADVGLQLRANRFFAGLEEGPSLRKVPIEAEDGRRLAIGEMAERIWDALSEAPWKPRG